VVDYAQVPVDDLKPFGMNPRQGDVGAISISLEANGQYRPIVVNRRDNTILAGNHTWHAAKSLGWATIDVGYVDVDDETAARIVLVDNRTNDLADYDRNILADLLSTVFEESGPDGLVGTGFDLGDFDEAVAQSGDGPRDRWNDRKQQGTPLSEKVETNQIWSVGPHILGCGDSRDPNWWKTLLAGQQASLVFTDPPYGINYSGGADVEREGLAGDTPEEAPKLLADSLDAVSGSVTAGAGCYVCLPSGDTLPTFGTVLSERKLWRWVLIWCKDVMTIGRGDYHPQHEIMVYGWWPTGPHHKVVDRTETSVWHIPRPTDSDLHPTSKPVELPARAIRNSTKHGQIVVDPFAGSGSTLIAAHREGRVGVGNEIEPGYVNAALGWLEVETGVERVRVL
jgi:hypothetical protein